MRNIENEYRLKQNDIGIDNRVEKMWIMNRTRGKWETVLVYI